MSIFAFENENLQNQFITAVPLHNSEKCLYAGGYYQF